MNDDIQRLVESLRSPGLESELRGESFAVDAIASTMTTKDSSMKNRLPRKARVASFIAAGIIGFGGVAAAGPTVIDQIDGTPDESTEPVTTESSVPESSVPESSVPESSVPESSVPESSVPESSVPESSVPDDTSTTQPPTDEDVDKNDAGQDADDNADGAVRVNDPDTAFDETKCEEGSHGKTVSSVARSDERTSQEVVDAAQSSCGKKTDADESDDAEEETEDADDIDDEGEAPEPEQDQEDGNGNGNSGNGNGGNSNSGNGNDGNSNSGGGNSNANANGGGGNGGGRGNN